jgi:PAS domain S-box-containing protein
MNDDTGPKDGRQASAAAEEEALRASEARLRAILESAVDYAIITLDCDGLITGWSPGAERLLLWTAADAVGQSGAIIFTPEDRAAAVPERERARAERDGRAPDERWHVRRDGSRFFATGALTQLRDGERHGFLKILRDRTEQQRNEERLRIAQEAGAVGTFEWYPETGKLDVSDAYRRIWGFTPETQITDELLVSLLHPDDRSLSGPARLGRDNPLTYAEYRIIRPDTGEERWIARRGEVVEGEAQGRRRFVGVAFDITERKRIEAALREETCALEILNRAGAALAAEHDLGTLVQVVTDAGVEITGAQFGAFFYNVLNEAGESYTLYALSGADRSHFDQFPMPRNTAVFAPTFRGEAVVRSDDILADPRYGRSAPHYGMPNGHLPVRSYLAVPVISRSGAVLGGLFFGHEQPGVFSERSERVMVGLAAEAAIAIDNARLFETAQRELEQRRRAEVALRELNATLEEQVAARTAERDSMWQVSQDLLAVVGPDGVFRAANPAWTKILGYAGDAVVGQHFSVFVHPDDITSTQAAVAHTSEAVLPAFENRFRRKDGAYRWISWTAAPGGGVIYGVGRDVTAEKEAHAELERAQEQLRQAQKMEAIGQLTGGVAHDFNNLLQVVVGNLEILQRNLPEASPRLKRSADNAMTGAKRAATLTQRLLAFSRRQPLAPKPINVNGLVSGMSELLGRTLGETIQLETVLAGGLWRVEADPNQLENAILNLAVNARDAMPDGGKLTIETANTHFDQVYVAQNAEVQPGQYVVICVSDTGHGMDKQTMARVFEPFFTTKEVGKGTGLGLSMVYGFVKQSGGHVKVYSEVGHGTTVKIYLPRLLGSLEADEAAGEPLVPEGTRSETVLVVEDDDDVRAYSVEVLRELGYRVLEAHDGPSALRLLERQEGRVDLLFSDVVLPSGLTGPQLVEAARALRPRLKVLFTTGYARNALVHHGRLEVGVDLITKPFSYADLAAKVRDMLDGD